MVAMTDRADALNAEPYQLAMNVPTVPPVYQLLKFVPVTSAVSCALVTVAVVVLT